MSEIWALSRQTGKPMHEFYRVRSRYTGWAYVAWVLGAASSLAAAFALRFRFHLHDWRVPAISWVAGFAVTFGLGFLVPLFRYRIEVKHEE